MAVVGRGKERAVDAGDALPCGSGGACFGGIIPEGLAFAEEAHGGCVVLQFCFLFVVRNRLLAFLKNFWYLRSQVQPPLVNIFARMIGLK